MFKNLKISTGINFLMITFVVFLTTLSFFNFTSARRFDSELQYSTSIVTEANDLQNASSALNTASGLVVMERLDSYRTSTPVEASALANINRIISDSSESYKRFRNLPELGVEERDQSLRLYTAFDNLMKLTLSERDALTVPNIADVTGLSEKSNQLRQELEAQRVAYTDVLNKMAQNHKQQAQTQNTTTLLIAFLFLGISIIMLIFARWWFKNTLFARLDRTKETFAVLAAGDLSRPIDIGANNEIGEMLAELETMRVKLTDTVSDIRLGVTSIHGNARELSSSNQDLSSRTEQQASALQETAASMEELKITVRQNADNAHSAKQLVESASGSARKGGEVMVNLDGIMREITANSRQIADINGVIDSIANQTNILALNAAVEAARAGEQGRGFAVVAGEVRSLAKRSADAAKEIRQLINLAVDNMNTGSQEVELAGAAMDEVVKSVTQVTDIMSEITSASDEQSTGINQIAQAVNEMDSVTQQNASMVEQAANVARSLEESAQALENAVSQFSLQEGLQSNNAHNTKFADGMTGKKTLASNSAPTLLKSKADDDWVSF